MTPCAARPPLEVSMPPRRANQACRRQLRYARTAIPKIGQNASRKAVRPAAPNGSGRPEMRGLCVQYRPEHSSLCEATAGAGPPGFYHFEEHVDAPATGGGFQPPPSPLVKQAPRRMHTTRLIPRLAVLPAAPCGPDRRVPALPTSRPPLAPGCCTGCSVRGPEVA